MLARSVQPIDRATVFMVAGCLSGSSAGLALGFGAPHAVIALAGGLSALCWVLAGTALIARGLRR